MAVSRTVRVIRTWDITVTAEYGDTPESLCAKVSDETLDATAPDAETRAVLEEFVSPVDTFEEIPTETNDEDGQ